MFTFRSTTLNSDEHVYVSSLPYRSTPVPHHPTYERTTSKPTHLASLPLRQQSQGYPPDPEYGSIHGHQAVNPFIGPEPNYSHSPSLHLSPENEIASFSPKPDHGLPHQQVVLDHLPPHPTAGLHHQLAKEDLPPIPRTTPQPALFTPTPQPSHNPSFGGYQYTTRHSYVKVGLFLINVYYALCLDLVIEQFIYCRFKEVQILTFPVGFHIPSLMTRNSD